MSADDFDHCMRLVRRFDRDRYLSALFAPKELRGALFGLYAFNVEIGSIRENVTNPELGEIRLQWWRETVDRIYRAETPDGPVARALSEGVRVGRLSERVVVDMIEARKFDLHDDPMPGMNDLENYLAETSSALVLMASSVLTRGAESAYAEAAGHAGVAYGLTGLMRNLPHHVARGQRYLPLDELARRASPPEGFGKDGEGLRSAVRGLCARAAGRLDEARARSSTVPTAAIPAFLPVGLLDLYLPKIGKIGPELIRRTPHVTQLRRQWHLFRFAMREEF